MASHDDDRRDLLLAYRAHRGPPSRAAQHNWQQLARRIDAGEPAPALPEAEGDPPARRADPRARAWAIGLAAAAAALIAVRLAWPGRFAAGDREAGAAAPYHAGPEQRPQRVERPPPPPPAAAPTQPVPPDISPQSPPPPAIHRPVPHAMPERTPDDAEDLARELAAIRAAAQAVRDGDGATALRHADAYLAAHPRGGLVPEARLRRIEALCLLARAADARREVDAFLADYPHSPLRERAASICDSSHGGDDPRPSPDR